MKKIPTWIWIAGAAGLGWWLWKRKSSAAVPGFKPLEPGQLQPIGITIPTPIVPNLPDVGRAGAFELPTDFAIGGRS
jgi:hypothetical protein